MNKQLKQFWQDFCQSHNLEYDTPVEAWAFGATAEDADELADLVNRGIKTATTSAYELYDKNETIPQAGEWSIVLNSKEEPICVIQDKVVEIIPYDLISKNTPTMKVRVIEVMNIGVEPMMIFLIGNIKRWVKNFILKHQWYVKFLKR